MLYFSKNETARDVIQFTLPRLHRGKLWYVSFSAFDPVSNKLKEKRYSLMRYGNARQRRDAASIMIHNLIERLKAGWNPYVNMKKTRHFTPFSTVLQRYEDYILTMQNRKTMTLKTARDYLSRINILRTFIAESGVNVKYIYQFNKFFAIDFLDYLFYDRVVSATTRNNYRGWLYTLATWLIERDYLDENPVESINFLKQEEKFRDSLTASALKRLSEYLIENNRPFYLACMMEYYTFVRPDELRYITIGDISITNQSLYIHPEHSKNRKGQYVAINDALMKELIYQHVFDFPSQYYLFGNNITPGNKQIYINRFRNEWKTVRHNLNFPASYQFYSLKDSGIRDLANSQGIVIARDQARHSEISTTNKYLKQSNTLHDETKHFTGLL